MDTVAQITQLNSVSLHGGAFMTVYATHHQLPWTVQGVPVVAGGLLGRVAAVAEKHAFVEAAVVEHNLALQKAPQILSRYSAAIRERIGRAHGILDADGNRIRVVYNVEGYYLLLKDKDPDLEYQQFTVWDATYDRQFPLAWMIEYLHQERLTPQTQMEPMMRNVHALVEHVAWILDSMTSREQDDLADAQKEAQAKLQQIMVEQDASVMAQAQRNQEMQ